MKKVILAIAFVAVSVSSAFSSNDVPTKTVKLGELVNGEIKLTYDVSTLKSSLGIMVAQDNQEIEETALFMEDGKYYLWGSIVDKTTKMSKGKLVFSVEKDEKNNFQLSAKPVYSLKCVAVNCVTCKVVGSTCFCEVSSTPSGGDCEWKKVVIGDDGGPALYDNMFDQLYHKRKG